jgi:hypothetical protein
LVPTIGKEKKMPREKQFTKTVAFRVTAREWEAIQHVIETGEPIWSPQPVVPKRPSDVIRLWIARDIAQAIEGRDNAIKKAEVAARRAAKKAQANNDNA